MPLTNESTHREKRAEIRHFCQCGGRYAVFGDSDFLPARIVDYSDAGMRLKTKAPLETGALLMIRVIGPTPDFPCREEYCCPRNRSIGVGLVKWCRRADVQAAGVYESGLKFQLP